MKKLILMTAVVASLACDGSRTETMQRLAQMEEISAQKDSLLKDVTATTAFLADLGRQVSTVRNLKAGRDAAGNVSDLEDRLTPNERRALLLAKVQEITERVNMAENRLAVSRKRVAELTGTDAEKSRQLAAFDSTITAFRGIMDSQKEQIVSFTNQVNALTAEVTQLKADNVSLVADRTTLTVQRDSVTNEANTVYYVADNVKALVDRHIIQKTGGFLGLGKTPVPVRDVDHNQFVQIDLTKVSEIPLPHPEKEYRVITRQDLAALETPPDKDGYLKGSIRIRDPKAFWSASKYLIIVEK